MPRIVGRFHYDRHYLIKPENPQHHANAGRYASLHTTVEGSNVYTDIVEYDPQKYRLHIGKLPEDQSYVIKNFSRLRDLQDFVLTHNIPAKCITTGFTVEDRAQRQFVIGHPVHTPLLAGELNRQRELGRDVHQFALQRPSTWTKELTA